MTISYAMLLDGGFIRHKLGTAQKPADAAAISAFATALSKLPCLRDMRLHRIYFYDSKPLEIAERTPLSGDIIDFGASTTAARNKSLQASLVQHPLRCDLASCFWKGGG